MHFYLSIKFNHDVQFCERPLLYFDSKKCLVWPGSAHILYSLQLCHHLIFPIIAFLLCFFFKQIQRIFTQNQWNIRWWFLSINFIINYLIRWSIHCILIIPICIRIMNNVIMKDIAALNMIVMREFSIAIDFVWIVCTRHESIMSWGVYFDICITCSLYTYVYVQPK